MKRTTFDLDIYSCQIITTSQFHNIVYVNCMKIGWLKMLDATIAYKTPLFSSDQLLVEMYFSTLGYSSTVMYFHF
jgi:acyl-CoA thioesterase FadM